ncbi:MULTISPECIES: hypothetical protein [unclassified Kineosporia]|uniref:hypothetical protein n=1 Tax=unclassified Kineosporia TaxID=2626061 RepID=UPI0013044A81|nr:MULTISPECIES: hypothetical protein [unclassified Kineosporia]
MFAVAALVCFVLALLDLSVGFSLTTLGLALVAAHLAFGAMVPALPTGRRR